MSNGSMNEGNGNPYLINMGSQPNIGGQFYIVDPPASGQPVKQNNVFMKLIESPAPN